MGTLKEEIKRILRDIEVEQAYGLPEEKKEEMLGIVAEMRVSIIVSVMVIVSQRQEVEDFKRRLFQ